ncbi:MAG: CoA-disulfide reductase [Candidatus Marinimicrobia bacterium]|nr:CoA-disulfide reductase [Candidatus Neomarinimicrobiota bacterium]
MPKKFVIIGGDAAGMSAASKIRRMQPEAEMIVFEKGDYISFAACGIPYWISGVIDDGSKLQVLTPEIAKEKRNIDVRILHEVTKIDSMNNRVTVTNLETSEQYEESYDALLIATGARAAIPPIPGIENDGVFTLRSLADGHLIKDYLAKNKIKHATIIGGGYIGLEMAETYRHLNIAVTMVELLDQIAPTFDKDILVKVTEHIVENGVDLRLDTRVNGIDKTARLLVKTSAGDIPTDMVIVSTGVRPNSELAGEAGISLGKSGAITINSNMQTSISNIYAAGDCAEYKHLVLEEDIWIPLAPSANKGGRIAGENMAGQLTQFPGILGTAVVKVFDYTIAQTGLTEKQAEQSSKYGEISTTMITGGSRAHYYPGSTPITIKMVVEKSSKRLLGAQIIGKADVAKRVDVLATAITARMTVEEIGLLDLTYAPPVAPVYDPIHVAANVANK